MNMFNNDRTKTTVEIIRESIDVSADGSVSFRCDSGRGRGRATKIPADQFDEFVKVLQETANSREKLAEKQKELDNQ